MFVFLKSLFFPSVSDVVASIQRKVDQLNGIDDRKAAEADELGNEIARLEIQRSDCLVERERAKSVRRKLAALISTGDAQ